jgi:hypothetical protein
MDRTINPAAPNGKNRVARLVGSLIDLKSLPAKSEHLWHKRHAIEASIAIESIQDFILAANFYPIAHFQLG